jgi:hypothetical protein
VCAQFLEWIESLAVISASGAAVWGINTWQREHVGRRRIDLAEETLTLFYEVCEVINGARSAIGWESEYREAEKRQNEASGKESGPQGILIVTDRLNRRSDLFAKIRTLRYRFAAVFGHGAEKPFYDLVRLKNEVVIAERRLPELRRERSRSTGEAEAKCAQRIGELSDVVEGGGDDSDPTTQRLKEIVEQVERVCRPVIQGGQRARGEPITIRTRRALRLLLAREWVARLRRIWTRGPHGA